MGLKCERCGKGDFLGYETVVLCKPCASTGGSANTTTNIGSAFASQMPCSPCTASRGIQNCDGHFGSSSCAVCITRHFAHA